MDFYKPVSERMPDTQYQNAIRYILDNGELAADTPQDVSAITCLTVPRMVFDFSNGVPLITERKIGFWRKPIAEIIAFINGARTVDEIEAFGCDFWSDYRGAGSELGLDPDDLGPGSYGAAFHDYEVPEGGTLNQFEQVLEQIRNYPHLRTLLITPWKPYYTARGKRRKVVVAPCHGWVQFRILNGTLHMIMDQRSADVPIGVPSNMLQYAALMLMVCQVTGYPPGKYIHTLKDAHVYQDQVEAIENVIQRTPRHFPTLHLDPDVTNLFDFRIEHFALEDYDPHPPVKIPYTP